MPLTQVTSIESHFANLTDPRIDRTKKHKLLDIIVIAICATICGADGFVAVQAFGKAKFDWFATFLQLPFGIPSHDTFGRVFAALDPKQFQHCFFSWTSAVSSLCEGEIVPIDGKQLKRSYNNEDGKAAVHLVSAWSSANGLALGQVKVAEKSNEITAIPQLLDILNINGCIVTIDAMGTQKQIAKKIVEQQADYVLALKKNQGQLYEDVCLLFDDLQQNPATSLYDECCVDSAQTIEKDHGRIETRKAITLSGQDCISSLRNAPSFANFKTVVKVTCERDINDNVSVESRYYISSLDSTAEKLLLATRTHWGIENCVHWILDVGFGEDYCRIRKGNAAENFAILRRIALNLLKAENSVKLGTANKRLNAGWDNDYLMKVLSTLFH